MHSTGSAMWTPVEPYGPQWCYVDTRGSHMDPRGARCIPQGVLCGPQGSHMDLSGAMWTPGGAIWTPGVLDAFHRECYVDPRGAIWTPVVLCGPRGEPYGPQGCSMHSTGSAIHPQVDGISSLRTLSGSWCRRNRQGAIVERRCMFVAGSRCIRR